MTTSVVIYILMQEVFELALSCPWAVFCVSPNNWLQKR